MSSRVDFRFSVRMIFIFCFTSSLLYALAAARSKSPRLVLAARVMPDSRSTTAAAMTPETSASIRAKYSSNTFSLAMRALRQCKLLERERLLGFLAGAAGHGKVRLGTIQHEINEDAGLGRHRANDVVLF